MRQAHRAESSGVLIVSNVSVRVEAKHSILRLSLHDMLQESLTYKLMFIECFLHLALPC